MVSSTTLAVISSLPTKMGHRSTLEMYWNVNDAKNAKPEPPEPWSNSHSPINTFLLIINFDT